MKDKCCLEDFCSVLVSAGKSILESDDVQNPGWFEMNKEMLIPLFEKRNKLLFKTRSQCGNDNMLKTKYADAKKDIHGAICITKNIWVNNVTESVHSVKFSPKEV